MAVICQNITAQLRSAWTGPRPVPTQAKSGGQTGMSAPHKHYEHPLVLPQLMQR